MKDNKNLTRRQKDDSCPFFRCFPSTASRSESILGIRDGDDEIQQELFDTTDITARDSNGKDNRIKGGILPTEFRRGY